MAVIATSWLLVLFTIRGNTSDPDWSKLVVRAIIRVNMNCGREQKVEWAAIWPIIFGFGLILALRFEEIGRTQVCERVGEPEKGRRWRSRGGEGALREEPRWGKGAAGYWPMVAGGGETWKGKTKKHCLYPN